MKKNIRNNYQSPYSDAKAGSLWHKTAGVATVLDIEVDQSVPEAVLLVHHQPPEWGDQLGVLRQLLPEEDLGDGPVAQLPGGVEAEGEGEDLRDGETGGGEVVGTRDQTPPAIFSSKCLAPHNI